MCRTKPNVGELGYLGEGGERAGQFCQTKPILRLRISDWGKTSGRTPALPPAAGRLRQTNPILRWSARVSESEVRQTKPNLDKMGGLEGCFQEAYCAKQSQFFDCGLRIADSGQTCGGTARSSLPPRACAGRLYKQTQLAGANRAKRTQSRGVKCAKRTQFRPGRAGRALGDEGRMCETKPIPSEGQRVRCLLGNELWWIRHAKDFGKTKPIRGGAAGKTIVKARGLGDATPQGSNCVKQTQFGPGAREQARAAGSPCRGAIVRNKANLPPRPRTGTGRGSHRRGCRSGVLRQTNPICGRQAGKTIPRLRGGRLGRRPGRCRPRGANVRNKANLGRVSSLEAVGAGRVRVPIGSVSPVGALPKRDISRLGSPPRACPSGGRPRGAAPTHFTLGRRPFVRNEAIGVRQSGPSSCYIGVRRSLMNQNHGQDARATKGPFRCTWKIDSWSGG
jgi:hypothetical protein